MTRCYRLDKDEAKHRAKIITQAVGRYTKQLKGFNSMAFEQYVAGYILEAIQDARENTEESLGR